MYTVRNNKTGKILGKYKTLEEAEKIHGKTYPVDKDKDYMRWFGKQTTDPIVITNTGESYIERNNQLLTPTKGTEVEANPTYNLSLDFNPDGTKRSTLAKAIGGYDMYTGNPNYYHGNFTNDFLKSLGYAGITGAGIATPMLIPEVAGALNLYGAYHGLTNYAKDYHPIETFKKALNGNYFGALKDIGKVGLDVAEALPFIGTSINFLNKSKNTADLIGRILALKRAAQFAKNLEESAIINSAIPEALTFTKSPLRLPYNPNSHLQGDAAVLMFKEYGGIPIPKGSINGELLRMYVPEVRGAKYLLSDDKQFDNRYDNLFSRRSGKMTRLSSAECEVWPYIWKFDLPTNDYWYINQIRLFNNIVSPRFSNYGILHSDFTPSDIVKVPNSNPNITGLYNNNRAMVRLSNNLYKMKLTAAHESFGHSTEEYLPRSIKDKWKNLFKEIDKNGIGTLTNVRFLNWRELRADIYALLRNLKASRINVDNLSDAELLDEFDQLGTAYSLEIVNNLYPNIGEPILRKAPSNIPEKVYITDKKNKLHFIGSTNPTMNTFREAINYWPILTLPIALGGAGYLINK